MEEIRLQVRAAHSKRTIIVGLLTTVFCAGCLTARHPEANEPSYQERQLSEWLRDFDNYNQSPENQTMAAEAMRHIGSQAVPFLVERLGQSQSKRYQIELQKWRDKQSANEPPSDRPANPRREAMAALDALGSFASDALPALEKLLCQDPPDLSALYIVARIGPAGVPLLTKSLTNEVKAVRLSAHVCLGMMSSHSETLYPQIPVGPDAPSFDRRITEFNGEVLQAAVIEYGKEHPELNFPANFNSLPPSSIPVPVQ